MHLRAHLVKALFALFEKRKMKKRIDNNRNLIKQKSKKFLQLKSSTECLIKLDFKSNTEKTVLHSQ